MEIAVNVSTDSAHIVVSGEIDEQGAEDLKRRFGEIDLSKAKTVTFDFAGVTQIGSAGLGKLLLFYKAAASKGGNIRVERVSQNLSELFQQLKLDTIFSITR